MAEEMTDYWAFMSDDDAPPSRPVEERAGWLPHQGALNGWEDQKADSAFWGV